MKREIVTVPLLVFIASVLSALAYDDLRRAEIRNEQWAHSQHESEVLHSHLQSLLDQSAKPIHSLSRWIAANPDISEETFSSYASTVLNGDTLLAHIAWLPDMVVRYIYPLEGNESVLGLDVAAHPAQRVTALKARDSGEILSTAPLDLVQGGSGIIVRAPVFAPEGSSGEARFIGLVSAVIRVEHLLQQSGLTVASWHEHAALRIKPDVTGSSAMIYGQSALFDADAIVHEVSAPGAAWQLAVQPTHSGAVSRSLLLGRVLSLLLVLLLTTLSALMMFHYRNRITSAERQRHEREFIDSVINTVGNVICVMNRRGEIVRFNAEAERVSGYSAGELLSNYVWDYLIPDEQVEGVKGVFSNLLAGNFPNQYVNHWKHRDGSKRLISWSNTALLDSRGEVEFVVATGIDITESEQREREREQLQRQLQQAQKMEALGQLTGGVAHDFNNILAAIMGNAELATLRFASEGDGKLAHYLNEITRSAERAKKLVQQMLAFSRGEQLPTTAIQLENVIEQLLVMLNSIMPATIEIRTDIAQQLPDVLADENQLDQVLLNLAINGRDAIDGRGVLTISVAISEAGVFCRSCHEKVEGTFMRLSVTDSAGALAPELIDNIFDPFFTTKEVGKGTGMGLSMVHGIVHGWGGHLGVEVEPGKTTTFHLYLPLAQNR